MKKLILILLLISSATIWMGCNKEKQSGTITGVVTDAKTGEPVGNANVKLNPRGETTLTGNDGTFQFNDMTEGKYSLSISKVGYVDLDDDYVINLTKGQTIRRDVQLKKGGMSFMICKDGEEVDYIDFGDNTSYNQIVISIVNNGTVTFNEITLSHSTDWISFGGDNHYSYYIHRKYYIDGEHVRIYLDRSKLSLGENTTYINISAGPLSKSLEVKATKNY